MCRISYCIGVGVLLICLSAGTAVATSVNPFSNRTKINQQCGQNRCNDCISAPGCGWCSTSWTCMYGNASGPVSTGPGTHPLPCKDSGWVYSATNDPSQVCSYSKGTAVQDPAGTPAIPKEYDVVCLNGGQRHWADGEGGKLWGTSCCDCPVGWGGVDCGTCMMDDVCKYYGVDGDFSCQNSLFPTTGPVATKAQFSCGCSGDLSNDVCYALAVGLKNSMRFVVDYDAASYTANVSVVTAAPKSVPNLLLSGISFAADLTECTISHDIGPCPTGEAYNWNDNNQTCAQIKCTGVKSASCPFPDHEVAKCPNPPPKGDEDPCYPAAYGTCKKCVSEACWDRSWRYRSCSPVATYLQSATFTCQYSPETPGEYRCAYTQSGFGPIALDCVVGTCQYQAP